MAKAKRLESSNNEASVDPALKEYVEQLGHQFGRLLYAEWLAGLWFAAGQLNVSTLRLRSEMKRLNLDWRRFRSLSERAVPSPFNCNNQAMSWAWRIDSKNGEATDMDFGALVNSCLDIPFRTYAARLDHCAGGMSFAYEEFVKQCAEGSGFSDRLLMPHIESIHLDWRAYKACARQGREKAYKNHFPDWRLKNNEGKSPSDFRWPELGGNAGGVTRKAKVGKAVRSSANAKSKDSRRMAA